MNQIIAFNQSNSVSWKAGDWDNAIIYVFSFLVQLPPAWWDTEQEGPLEQTQHSYSYK